MTAYSYGTARKQSHFRSLTGALCTVWITMLLLDAFWNTAKALVSVHPKAQYLKARVRNLMSSWVYCVCCKHTEAVNNNQAAVAQKQAAYKQALKVARGILFWHALNTCGDRLPCPNKPNFLLSSHPCCCSWSSALSVQCYYCWPLSGVCYTTTPSCVSNLSKAGGLYKIRCWAIRTTEQHHLDLLRNRLSIKS